MSDKIDPRTRKTRKAIEDALAGLLTQKELHKVTVQEITEIADINRGTFYKHYLDIYDLYDKMESDILLDIGMLALQLEELPSNEFFKHLIDFIDGRRTIFQMIFSPNSTGQIRARLTRCIDGVFRKVESEKQHIDLNDDKLNYRTCYRSQGCIAVIAKWVNDGFKESKDFVVSTISELDSNTEKFIVQSSKK